MVDAIEEAKALVAVDIARSKNTAALIVPLVAAGVVATILALYCIHRNHKTTKDTIQDVRKSVKLGSKQFKHIHSALATMNEGTFEMVYPEQGALEPRVDESQSPPVLSRGQSETYTASTTHNLSHSGSDSAPLLATAREDHDRYVTPQKTPISPTTKAPLPHVDVTPSRSPSMVLTFKRASVLPSFEDAEAASLEEIATEIAQEEEERRQGSRWVEGPLTLARGLSLATSASRPSILRGRRRPSEHDEVVVVPRPPFPDITMATSSSGETGIPRWTEEEASQLDEYVDDELRTSVRASSGFL